MRTYGICQRTKEIKVPTLVIAGEMDYFFKVEEVQKVADEIEGAEFKLVKTSGHLPNMERAQEFNQLIKRFYGK